MSRRHTGFMMVIVFVIIIGFVSVLIVDAVPNDRGSYFTERCEDRFGEGWQFMDELAGPNIDKNTTTIVCWKGWTTNDSRTIEVEPYPE